LLSHRVAHSRKQRRLSALAFGNAYSGGCAAIPRLTGVASSHHDEKKFRKDEVDHSLRRARLCSRHAPSNMAMGWRTKISMGLIKCGSGVLPRQRRNLFSLLRLVTRVALLNGANLR
jgi:hypothetical protein